MVSTSLPETFLTGLWWWFLARRLTIPIEFRPHPYLRVGAVIPVCFLWLGSIVALFSPWEKGDYLALILAWALLPLLVQVVFGADFLWHSRKLLALTIFPMAIYLSAADSLAIASGTWQIHPMRSTGGFVGALPIEEAIFFLLTVTLIASGLTLALHRSSQVRWRQSAIWFRDCVKTRKLNSLVGSTLSRVASAFRASDSRW